MIAQLRGRLASKEPHRIIVDVGGVGYLVLIPLSTFYRLPEVPAEVMLHTFTHVREDAIQLFGFHTRDEQTLFELLQGVSGIGPRLATNILSGISVDDLVAALSQGDVTRLRAVPGVGKKLAERLVLELRERPPAPPCPPRPRRRPRHLWTAHWRTWYRPWPTWVATARRRSRRPRPPGQSWGSARRSRS